MLATEQMRFVLTPDQKKMLEFLAKREGRSKSNLVKWLITERYQQVAKPGPVTEPRPVAPGRTLQAAG